MNNEFLVKRTKTEPAMIAAALEYGFSIDEDTTWCDSEMDNQSLNALQEEVERVEMACKRIQAEDAEGVSWFMTPNGYIIIVKDQGYVGIFYSELKDNSVI